MKRARGSVEISWNGSIHDISTNEKLTAKMTIKANVSSGDVTRDELQCWNNVATIRNNVGTMLQPFETMSQQCCNAVLR